MSTSKTVILFFVLIMSVFTSCQKGTDDICTNVLECNDECIDAVQNQDGLTAYLSCFDSYGIMYTVDENNHIYVIPYDWDSSYESDSIQVKFCGLLFENDIPLAFPDPSFGGYVYRIKLEEIANF